MGRDRKHSQLAACTFCVNANRKVRAHVLKQSEASFTFTFICPQERQLD